MALSTFSELKTAISAWLAQNDIGNVVEDLIQLAESRMRRDLRVRQMLASTGPIAWSTTTDGQVPLPDRWVETVRFYIDDESASPPVLSYVQPRELEKNQWAAGSPAIYSLVSPSYLQVAPVPGDNDDASYVIDFYQYPLPLDDVNETNWILDEAPGLYLYGSLVHAEPYLGNDARLQTWAGLYAGEVQMLQNADMREKYRPGARMTPSRPIIERGRRRV